MVNRDEEVSKGVEWLKVRSYKNNALGEFWRSAWVLYFKVGFFSPIKRCWDFLDMKTQITARLWNLIERI